MSIAKLQKTGPIWGLVVFILGAVVSGSAIGAFGHSVSTVQPSDASHAQALSAGVDGSLVLPQKLIVLVVKDDEIEAALQDLPEGAQRKIRKDVAAGKYRLLWITAWDWDTTQPIGDTISILRDEYR